MAWIHSLVWFGLLTSGTKYKHKSIHTPGSSQEDKKISSLRDQFAASLIRGTTKLNAQFVVEIRGQIMMNRLSFLPQSIYEWKWRVGTFRGISNLEKP